jgi:hypothetical protein
MNTRIKIIIGLLAAIFLTFGYLQFFPRAAKTEANVYPDSVKKLSSLELGELIFFLMPSKDSNFIDWGYLSNTKIIWQDDTYKTTNTPQGTYNSRVGLVRANVMGNISTILKKQTTELAWSVVYESYGNPKFGVEVITIKPGTDDSDGACFGSTSDNCSFNPIKSFDGAKIKYRQICKSSEKVGYQLSAEGKKTIKAAWITSTGSGGSSSWIELYMNGDKANICDE